MLNDLEKALNDTFTKLFEKNYSWLLWIVLIHLIVFIIYIIIQIAKHHKTDNTPNNEILELKKEIQSLKFRLDYVGKSHNNLKESLDTFKKEHQNTSLEEMNAKLDHIQDFFKSNK